MELILIFPLPTDSIAIKTMDAADLLRNIHIVHLFI